MKQNIVLVGAVLAAALGGAAFGHDPADDRIRRLEERIDRLERHSTRLGFEHDRRVDYGRTDCGTREVATGIDWQEKTLRCAELTDRDD